MTIVRSQLKKTSKPDITHIGCSQQARGFKYIPCPCHGPYPDNPLHGSDFGQANPLSLPVCCHVFLLCTAVVPLCVYDWFSLSAL